MTTSPEPKAPVCEACGITLVTVDLPCPRCDPVDVHEFFSTHRNRHRGLFRNKPDRFAAEVNAWLATQRRLLAVYPAISWDAAGVVREITFTCVEGRAPVSWTFRLDRTALLRDPLGVLGRTSLGDALNAWGAANEDRERVNHVVCESAGVPMEVWILSVDRQSP